MGGAVDDDMANMIVAQLLYLDSVAPKKDITLYVNSPGGSVTAGMAIFDTMRHVRPNVSTMCVGLAASMGAFILAAGQAGKRYSLSNSRIMIHQPLGGAQGQAEDVEIQVCCQRQHDNVTDTAHALPQHTRRVKFWFTMLTFTIILVSRLRSDVSRMDVDAVRRLTGCVRAGQ